MTRSGPLPVAAFAPGAVAWLVAFVPARFLAFPERFGEVVVDVGLLLGPVSVALLLLGIAGLGPGRAARRAFLAGWLAHATILHWIYVVTVRHGDASPAVGVLAVLALALYPAAALAAAGAVVARLARTGRAHPLVVAAVFTVAEHLQSFVATGFPWALLGYSQLDNPLLLPLARLGGVYLVGYAAALGGVLLAGLAGAPGPLRRPAPGLRVALAVWVALHGVGLFAAERAASGRAPDAGPRVRVAALQGSFEQGEKWSPALFERTLSVYETLGRAASRAGAELIVWPETAVPGALEVDAATARRIAALVTGTGAAHVVGAVGVDLAPGGDAVGAWYDSAFVIGPDGRLAGRYDKTQLVPFGEYLPFRSLLGRFFEAMARGVAALDVSAGRRPHAVAVSVPTGDRGELQSVRLGVPICYELLFPDRVRRFVGDGAVLLVAITNDAWYGRTGAPHQLLAITAMRAAENGVPLVRAANTGISAVIDARGRVREQSRLFERGLVLADVPLPRSGRTGAAPAGGTWGAAGRTGATVYTRHGDVFAWACWVAVVVPVAAGRGRSRGGRTPAEGPPGDGARERAAREASGVS